MFRKLISNLPFSPSLIDQLAHYAKHLKRESRIRQLGLVWISLAVAVQLLGSLFILPPLHAAKNYQEHAVLGVSTTTRASSARQQNTSVSTNLGGENHPASGVLNPHLPDTTRHTWLTVSCVFLAGAAFFYARGRLLAKELSMIKADITSSGGI